MKVFFVKTLNCKGSEMQIEVQAVVKSLVQYQLLRTRGGHISLK